MSNKTKIEEALHDLILKEDREFVAMLSGEWGIGKTYFWNEFKDKYLKTKDVVYISLFGKNSLQDIEVEIVTKLSKYTKGLKKYTKHLDTVSNLGSKAMGLPINVSVGSILSLFSPNDFKNIIICFDDFERLSEKTSLKDVMGLISQFKEQKECKVIMILNEKELNKLSSIDGKKHDEIFSLYKEKVVDYSFHYQPDHDELVEAIKEDIEKITFCEHQTIDDFFKKIDLKNIRIMKQALYLLEKFSLIDNHDYDKKVVDEFVEIALNLFVFRITSNFSYQKLQDFKLYKTELLSETLFPDNKKVTRNADFDKYFNSYLEIPYYLTNDNMEKIIYTFIVTHIVDIEAINNLLNINNTHLDKENIRENIFKYYNMARFDFKSSVQECAKNIFTLLDKKNHLVPYILTLKQLNQYLLFIEEHTTLISQDFKDNYIKQYITLKPSQGGYQGEFNYARYKSFIEMHYPHLLGYLNSTQHNSLLSTLTIKTLDTILNKVNHGFGPEDTYILDNTSPDTYKKHIIESDEFYQSIIGFLTDNHDGFFNIGIQNIKQALIELSKENKDNLWRINQFTNETNIKLEEKE